MTTNKTVIITSGVTWTVPVDFVSLIAVHAIGGGCCGSPGFQGAVSLENAQPPDVEEGATAGFGGQYNIRTTALTVPLAPGQVLNCHVATASPSPATLDEWQTREFNGVPPSCLSDDTWLKDNGGNYIILAPGGDSNSSPVGNNEIDGGRGYNGDVYVSFVSGNGGGGGGGPNGSSRTGDGGSPLFINPTQIKLFGSGGGDGNVTHGTGSGGSGDRTTAGAGFGAGASSGGDGGDITGNVSVSSSLLLPSLDFPFNTAPDAARVATNFLLGAGDFTLELLYQTLLDGPGGGTLLSVWDTSAQRSWLLATTGDGIQFTISTNGTNEQQFAWTINQHLVDRYTNGLTYYGPPANPLGWTHIAVCRAAGVLRAFVDGYPWQASVGGTYNYTLADAHTYFASTANLTIGASLAAGAVDVSGANGYPSSGWLGNMRITVGTALYTCPATGLLAGSGLGQQFTPPTAPMTGGNFNCDWPGNKGDTSSTWTDGASNPHTVTFLGSAVIDSDQYCYPPPSPEVGGDGNPAAAGNLWTDGNLTVGPGGGGGGGGGDVSRYRMATGGTGGDGGLYGGGGGQGGGINSGSYVGLTLIPTTAFSVVPAGRNIGSHHFRDPANPQFAYHLRETNPADFGVGAAIQMVKINVTTGALVASGTAYTYASNLGALGACFVNGGATNIDWDTNVTGGMASGDKLYIAASDQNLDGTDNSAIIEFDKTTLNVTNHWNNGASEPTSRSRGTSVMNADGSFFANGGNDKGSNPLTDCFIQLLKPSTGDYGYVSVKTLLGFNCALDFTEGFDGPLCFDDGGNLWFVAQPITAIVGTDYVSGKSKLCKCSLTAGGGTISLTLTNSWTINDNYSAYGANAFSQSFSYRRISFDQATKKIHLWSTYQALISGAYTQGWYLEWSTLSETFTRGPLNWTAGTPSIQRSPRDLIGWTGGVDSLLSLVNPFTVPAISLFNIATGLETFYPVSTWAFSDPNEFSMRAWTFVYSQESPDGSFEFYAFDEGLDSSGGVHDEIYTDALFTLTTPDIGPGLGGEGAPGLIVIEYVSSESPTLTGNITETLTPIDTQSSQLIGGAQTTEALNPIDTVDATLIPVTRPKWLTIGGDSSDSIFPN